VLQSGYLGNRQARLRDIFLIIGIALILSVFFFSPRLWLLDHYRPGTMEWDRGHTYLLQAENPFRDDIENIMRWRFGPPLVANLLGMRGFSAQAIPWLGVAALLAYVAIVLRRGVSKCGFVLGGTVLVATTAAVVFPLRWIGLNDAWIWLCLLIVAFEDSALLLLLACLAGPWVDERFIIGLPLACVSGAAFRKTPIFTARLVAPAAAIAFYLAVRLTAAAYFGGGEAASVHLRYMLPQAVTSLRFGYLGWWMGLRAAWVPILAVALWHPRRWFFIAILAMTAVVTMLTTQDQSRSAAIALPAVVAGLLFIGEHSEAASKIALSLAMAGLLLPFAGVANNNVSLFDNLPVEIIRLLRP
jgi:hypothetical protein